MIGTQVLQFKILQKVGQGGMGEVYLAEDTQLERRVALKFLPEHFSQDPDFKARFQHEARAAAALNHPNIITVYQIGEHEGRLFMALELVEGQTLEELVRSGDLDLERCVDIALQICEGLGAAHAAGIVHRDIKPGNIVVDASGHVKILDFGLAKSKRATTETQVGTTVGTVQYESPEQGRSSGVDQRSDLFSLGVVLYELITGHRPFKGEFPEAIRYAIAHETPEPLARYKAGVPAELQRIVAKLLEKDPDLRYQVAGGIASDLKLLKRDSGPSPSSIHSVVGTAPPESRRGPSRLLIPVSLAAVLVVLLLVFKPWKIAVEPSQEAAAAEDRLAVMYFDNLTDPEDSGRQGEVVSSLLISDMSESEYLQVVSSQRLYDILKQLGREGTRTITPDVATEVARKAGARWMLTGRILDTEPQWVIAAQLSDVATGDLIASPTISGLPGERVYEAVDRLTARIKQELALPAEALAELDPPVVELTSASPEAYRLYLEAEELSNKMMHQEAEPLYRQALELDSTFAMAYRGLAWARMQGWGDWAGFHQAIGQAVAHIDHASDPDRLMIRSLYAFFSGRFEDAVAFAEQLIERDPDDKNAWEWLGMIYSMPTSHEDDARVIEMYRRVIELDPLHKQAYNQLAYAYDEIGAFEASIRAINKYIELAPNEPNPYDSRGELYANNGQVEEALRSYQKALEIKPDFLSSLLGAANMHIALEEYERVEELAASMIAHASTDMRAQGRLLWAGLPLYQGRFGEALRRHAEAIAADRQELGEGLTLMVKTMQRAEIYGELDHTADCERDLTTVRQILDRLEISGMVLGWIRAIEIFVHAYNADGPHVDTLLSELREYLDRTHQSDSAPHWMAAGGVALYRGEYDSSVVFLTRAAGTYPVWNDLVLLGRAYLGAGRLRDAIEMLEHAMESYEESRWGRAIWSVKVHYWLGQAYDRAGRSAQAVEQYERFLHLWRDADTELDEIRDARERLADL